MNYSSPQTERLNGMFAACLLAFVLNIITLPCQASAADKQTRARLNSSYEKRSPGLEAFELNQARALDAAKKGSSLAQFSPPARSAGSVEPVRLTWPERNRPLVIGIPTSRSVRQGRVLGVTPAQDLVTFSLLPDLQQQVEGIVQRTRAPHVAVVAMDPRTGRVLALADKSSGLRDAAFHAGFPAASLFKVVTAAAAVERARVAPDARIAFRGGNYTLNQWNYLPNTRTDRRVMSLTEALGRSCNPVFGRVALRFLTPDALESFAERFGFNEKIYFDAPLPESAASIPSDKYGLSRTAAGFGAVTISPIHAATLMAGLANGGKMSRPILIDKITNRNGQPIYSSHTEVIAQMVRPDTARKVLEMMKSTTTIGTSRKDFAASRGRPALPVNVAAKTGTLSGKNPKGLNHWFIATAPLENPKVAIAVIVVDPQNSSARAARVGREVLEYYLFRR